MGNESKKSLMQLQMDELKETHGVTAEEEIQVDQSGMEKDREIAELYADLAEYKLDLKCFEDELHLVKNNSVKDILNVLEEYKLDSRNYNDDLMSVLDYSIKQKIQEDSSYNIIPLDLVEGEKYSNAISKLIEKSTLEVIEKEIKEIFIKRWNMLIEIKKEHIKEETAEIKVRGLKPYYAQRIYNRYHGLEN